MAEEKRKPIRALDTSTRVVQVSPAKQPPQIDYTADTPLTASAPATPNQTPLSPTPGTSPSKSPHDNPPLPQLFPSPLATHLQDSFSFSLLPSPVHREKGPPLTSVQEEKPVDPDSKLTKDPLEGEIRDDSVSEIKLSNGTPVVTYRVNISSKPKIFPDPSPHPKGFFSHIVNFFKRCLRRPKPVIAATTITLTALVLHGMTFYFWVEENNNSNQKARNAHLVFIALANGFFIRFNAASFSRARPVVEVIDRIVQFLVFPVIIAEQGVVTLQFNNDWFSLDSEAFIIGLAGTFNGMRLDKIREEFTTSKSTLPEEVDYAQGLPPFSLQEEVIRRLYGLVLPGVFFLAGALGNRYATTENDRVLDNSSYQFAIALLTANILEPILDNLSLFRRVLAARTAAWWSSLAINFFPLAIRPGENINFGVLLGAILAVDLLSVRRIWRQQNCVSRKQAAMMAEVVKLCPEFNVEVEKALNEPISSLRKFLLLTEGQPVKTLSPKGKKIAAGVALVAAGGTAVVSNLEFLSLLGAPILFILNRYLQLTPREYDALCERERQKKLNNHEWLLLTGHRLFCKYPTELGMVYVATIKIWAKTLIDVFSVALFPGLAGIFYATDNRLPYLSDRTINKIKAAFQDHYFKTIQDKSCQWSEQDKQFMRDALGITEETQQNLFKATGLKLSYQEAVCLQDLLPSPLPRTEDTRTARFFNSPEVKISLEKPSTQSNLHKAAIAGGLTSDLVNAVETGL